MAGWPSGGGGGGGAVFPVGRRGSCGGSAHGVSEAVWLVAGERRQEAGERGDASTGEERGETGLNPVQRQKQQIGKNTRIRARRLNYHSAVSDTIWQPM